MAGLLDKAQQRLQDFGKKASKEAKKFGDKVERVVENLAEQTEKVADKFTEQAKDVVKELKNEFSGGGTRAKDCFKDLEQHFGKMCDQHSKEEVKEPKHGIERSGLLGSSELEMLNYCENELVKQGIVPCTKVQPVAEHGEL